MNRQPRRKILPLARKVTLSDTCPGPVRRATDPAWRPQIEVLHAKFAEVYPKTIAEWEDGFCRDLDPEREIAIWMNMAERLTRALGRRTFTLAERRDIFGLVLGWSLVMPPRDILTLVKSLDPVEADSILREIGGVS